MKMMKNYYSSGLYLFSAVLIDKLFVDLSGYANNDNA
jgi:hypothetical protein